VPYEEIFRSIAAEYNLDWHLLVEQAYRESRFDPLAVGKANDLGLMQVLPATWDEWAPKVGVYDPFDPASNVRVAAAYLDWIRAQLVKQGRPEPYWMLVAYNWGIGNVLKLLKAGGGWSQVPPERQAYAVDITLGAEANAVAEQMTAAARAVQG
jgi:soluble lytic murein transglycosylase-like protein